MLACLARRVGNGSRLLAVLEPSCGGQTAAAPRRRSRLPCCSGSGCAVVMRHYGGTGGKQQGGYQGFGSFHSDNVEELVNLPQGQYRPPQLPGPVREVVEAEAEAARRHVEGGGDMSGLFCLDLEGWTFLNHGAFGGALTAPFGVAEAWRRYCEAQPLRFFDRALLPHMVHALRRLAHDKPGLLGGGVDARGLVLLPNATAGLNAAIRSLLELRGGQAADSGHGGSGGPVVCVLDVGYGSVKRMARHLSHGRSVEVQVQSSVVQDSLAHGPMPWARWADLVLDRVSSCLSAHPSLRLLVLDHVTSNTALRMPVRRLVRLARSRGVMVVVDGAHGPVMQAKDLIGGGGNDDDEDEGGPLLGGGDACCPDVYVGNLHKWAGLPKGAAFMALHPIALSQHVKPLAISHGYDDGLASAFLYDGCRDYSSCLALPSALDLWHHRLPPLPQHSEPLLDQATRDLSEAWGGTGVLADRPVSASAMSLVRLPLPKARRATSDDAKAIQDRLHFEHAIEVPIKSLGDGGLYVRLSAHLYNNPEHYHRLSKAIQQICMASSSA